MTEKTMEIEKKAERGLVETQTKRARRTLRPRIDLFDAGDAIILLAELPGVKEDDVEIVLEKDRLTISGLVADRAPEGYRKVYSEFYHGDYKRSFILSSDIAREDIEASLINGVLRLSLPKAETAKARKIELQGSAS